MLPRIDGARQASVPCAAAFDSAERHPRVALVLGGAGLDRALTAQAARTLPAMPRPSVSKPALQAQTR